MLWRGLPTKTLASSIENRTKGYKLSKVRVTLHFYSNASGNDIIPIFFIGRSEKLRAIKKCMKSLYRYNTSSWEIKYPFSEWFHSIFMPNFTQNLEKFNFRKGYSIHG